MKPPIDPAEFGAINVVVSPAGEDLPWVIEGGEAEISGAGNSNIAGVSEGRYRVRWEDHRRWLAPRRYSEWQDLQPGFAITFSASYDSMFQLTDSPGYDGQPDWSPAPSNRLAFVSDREGSLDIYLLDVDMLTTSRLTYSMLDEQSPSWSPDATEIVYDSTAEGGTLDVIDVSDLTVRHLTPGEFYKELTPDWSPMGDCIVFWSTDAMGARLLEVISANGGERKQLVFIAFDITINEIQPSWHPSSQWIAVSSDRDVAGGSLDICRYGSARTGDCSTYQAYGFDNLTNESGIDHRSPCWSPDGAWLAYIRTGAQSDIWLMRVADRRQFRFTFSEASEGAPAWSPHGNSIAFSSSSTGDSEIWVKVFDPDVFK